MELISETFFASNYSPHCLVPTTNKLLCSQILLLTVSWFLPLLNHFRGSALHPLPLKKKTQKGGCPYFSRVVWPPEYAYLLLYQHFCVQAFNCVSCKKNPIRLINVLTPIPLSNYIHRTDLTACPHLFLSYFLSIFLNITKN